jgi:hypothetical protein
MCALGLPTPKPSVVLSVAPACAAQPYLPPLGFPLAQATARASGADSDIAITLRCLAGVFIGA